ncbi:MAG TPA: hypothetical protein VKR53_00970 [Puia sp.]|nr:hypothetical protein [Puia sp.]
MKKSKRDREIEILSKYEKVYKEFTDEQLKMFKNSEFRHTDASRRKAVNAEIKKRGLNL